MERVASGLEIYINLIRILSKTVMRRNVYYVQAYIFVRFVLLRFQRLLDMNLHWVSLPERSFKYLIEKYTDNFECIDSESCVLANVRCLEQQKSTLSYICSKKSYRKYKVITMNCYCIPENTVIISDTMSFNVRNALKCTEINNTCFILPSSEAMLIATEARISMVANPYEYTPYLTDGLLKNYFAKPRFLRLNDVFCIDTERYSQELLYSSIQLTLPLLYFKVEMLKSKDTKANAAKGSFVLQEATTLIQATNIHSYLPQRQCYTLPLELGLELDYHFKRYFFSSYLPTLKKPMQCLEDCILPFIKKVIDHAFHILPVFLVEGQEGCGKNQLIQMVVEKMGLNLYHVDFTDVQTLTSAQTEAKLRIVLYNAKNCAPCILHLSNIQIFGKTTEGENDERVLSTFAAELETLYKTLGEFPVIIIATTDGADLPAELQTLFIETINIDHLSQEQRKDLLVWLLDKNGLSYSGDLSKIVELCADFRLTDINTLLSHAVRIQYSLLEDKNSLLTLSDCDFMKAHEYMQSIYNDCEGAPRIPKVYWEDIGGLADLKHEITRRIQLPLMNVFGFTQSGLLLYGPPGTGKTLLAKAVATEYQLHFLSVKGPEVLNMYVGQSEKNVRQIFAEARAAAPCIIFFDELDSLAPNRGRSGDSGGVMDRVVSQLLAEMDGLEDSQGIFIIGATNRPDLIDPALLRPGRFDKMLYVGVHSEKSSKLSVLRALTRKFKLSGDEENLASVLDHLPEDVTGADLYAVCSDAWLRAARRVLSKRDANRENRTDENVKPEGMSEEEDEDVVTVEIEDFVEAARSVVPSVSKEEMQRYKKMQAELS